MNVLIFDFDGVIADSLNAYVYTFLDYCKQAGIDKIKTKKDFLELFEDNLYKSLARKGVSRIRIFLLVRKMKPRLMEMQKKVKLFPKSKQMLKELSKNNKIIIITSNHGEVVREVLKSKGMHYPVIGAEVDFSKVKKIKKIKRRYRGDYYYIGDTKGDILEGKKAKVKTVAVTWGWHNRSKLKDADYIVTNPRRLVKLFSLNF